MWRRWTELTGLDMTDFLFVFAGQISHLFSWIYLGLNVVLGVLLGVALIGGFGLPSLVHPVGLVALLVAGCLPMEGRQPWGRDARGTVGRCNVGVGRPISSAMAGGDVIVNVNSGAGGCNSVIPLLVVRASLNAGSMGAGTACFGDNGWSNLVFVASRRVAMLGNFYQMGFLCGGLLAFELGCARPGTLNDHSVVVNPFGSSATVSGLWSGECLLTIVLSYGALCRV